MGLVATQVDEVARFEHVPGFGCAELDAPFDALDGDFAGCTVLAQLLARREHESVGVSTDLFDPDCHQRVGDPHRDDAHQ